MKILGISAVETGEGSGKDEAAKYALEWAELHGLDAKRQGFADLLKLSGMRALGFPVELPVENAMLYADALKIGGTITIKISDDALTEAGGVEWQDGPQELTISGRDYWRFYGTEAHRDVFGYEFWVDALLSQYKYKPVYEDHYPGKLINPDRRPDLLVIPDTRFPNEAKAISDLGGTVLDIYRASAKSEVSHVSEAGFPAEFITCSINNDGSLDDLRHAVFETLDSLFG